MIIGLLSLKMNLWYQFKDADEKDRRVIKNFIRTSLQCIMFLVGIYVLSSIGYFYVFTVCSPKYDTYCFLHPSFRMKEEHPIHYVMMGFIVIFFSLIGFCLTVLPLVILIGCISISLYDFLSAVKNVVSNDKNISYDKSNKITCKEIVNELLFD